MQPKEQKKINPILRSRIIRLILRNLPVPLLPGPEIYDLINSIRRSQSDLGKQVEQAIDSLRKSSDLVSSLEKAVEESSEKLSKLEKQYEHYSRLANAKADEVEAILKEVESSLRGGQRKERLIALAINLLVGVIIFVAGSLLGNSLITWIKEVIQRIVT